MNYSNFNPQLKAGREVLAPDNSVVTILKGPDADGIVTVRRRGSYGATMHFSASLLRAIPEGYDAKFSEYRKA